MSETEPVITKTEELITQQITLDPDVILAIMARYPNWKEMLNEYLIKKE